MRKYKVYFEDETETVSWTWTGLNLQRTLIPMLVRILAMFILALKVSALVACTLHVTSQVYQLTVGNSSWTIRTKRWIDKNSNNKNKDSNNMQPLTATTTKASATATE